MFILNGKRINIYAPYMDEDGNTWNSLIDPAVRNLLGVQEIPDPIPPADYSEYRYFRTEQDTAPYVVFTPKPAEMLAAQDAAKIEEKKATVRDARELVINRLNGIASRNQRNNKNTVADACDVVIDQLLTITDNWPTNPDDVDALVLQRWQTAVAYLMDNAPEAVNAFNGLDL